MAQPVVFDTKENCEMVLGPEYCCLQVPPPSVVARMVWAPPNQPACSIGNATVPRAPCSLAAAGRVAGAAPTVEDGETPRLAASAARATRG